MSRLAFYHIELIFLYLEACKSMCACACRNVSKGRSEKVVVAHEISDRFLLLNKKLFLRLTKSSVMVPGITSGPAKENSYGDGDGDGPWIGINLLLLIVDHIFGVKSGIGIISKVSRVSRSPLLFSTTPLLCFHYTWSAAMALRCQ